MKNYIIVLLMLVFASGCSVEYNLYVDKKNITEDIKVISESQTDSQAISDFNEPIPAFYDEMVDLENFTKDPKVKYYNDKKFSNGEYTNYNLNYQFDYSNFMKSRVLKNEVSLFKFTHKNGIFYITTAAEIYAFNEYKNLSQVNVTINFSDDIEIVSSNAQETKNNSLYWKTNSKYFPISVAYKFKEKKDSLDNTVSEPTNNLHDSNSFAIIGLSLLMFFVLIFIVIKFKGKRF